MKLFLFAAAATVAFAVPTFAQMADGPAGKMMRSTTRADAEARAKAHFAKMDLNHDGFVTPEEIHAGIDQRMAAHRGEAFDRLDTDHNGTITREEFSARPDGPAGGRIVERRVERTTPDGDKDGKPGMRMMMHQGGPGGGHMMMMTDTDKDGRISEAESVVGALKMFDMADANHDGTVTIEERKSAMQAFSARMHDGAMGDMPPTPPAPAG